MIETIEFKGEHYPILQSQGFASQYAFPFAKKLCIGDGLDIGCMKPEWAYPGSRPIDISFNDGFDAFKLPPNPNDEEGKYDYIFSSHCLEHIGDWVAALEYWHSRLKDGGVLFLYLPNMDEQKYWRPWHNRKHIHYFTPEIFKKYFKDNSHYSYKKDGMWCYYMVSGVDLNASFYVVADKHKF